jgi:aminoglycoside phosphotransferase (APT) family kinase protein
VLFEGASAGLVDFDTMCLAEPALDLGQFCAYLRVAARKAERAYPSIPPGLGNELCEQFLGAYLESANARTRQGEQLRERLWMYDAISLLRMAVRSWHQLKAQRLMSVLSVLEERMA